MWGSRYPKILSHLRRSYFSARSHPRIPTNCFLVISSTVLYWVPRIAQGCPVLFVEWIHLGSCLWEFSLTHVVIARAWWQKAQVAMMSPLSLLTSCLQLSTPHNCSHSKAKTVLYYSCSLCTVALWAMTNERTRLFKCALWEFTVHKPFLLRSATSNWLMKHWQSLSKSQERTERVRTYPWPASTPILY